MAKIRFENGMTVNFEGEPTSQDIEEVANSLNLSNQPIKLRDIQTGPRNFGETYVGQFLKSSKDTAKAIPRGIIEPLLKNLLLRPLQGAESLISGQPPVEFNYPFPKIMGGDINVKPVRTVPQALGATAQTAALAIPGMPTLAGILYGAGGAMDERKSGGQIAKEALMGGTIGKVAGMTLGGQPLLTGRTGKVVGNIAKGATEFPSKAGRWTGRNIGGITDATESTILKYGAKDVFQPKYAQADFITQDLAPSIESTFRKSVQEFTPEIQNYAKSELKIPESAINTIKTKGVNAVNQTRQTLGDTTDVISQNMKEGFQLKNQSVKDAYAKALSNYKGNTIESSEFFQAIQKGLRDKGWIDLQGNPTTRYKSGLDPVFDKLTNMYEDMRTPLSNRGTRVTGKVISKEDFSTYRDALGSMLKEKPSDRLVMSARNSLYNSAENSGIKGIKTARDMERQVFEMEDKFLDSQGNLKALGKEKTLDNFHNLSKDQIRQLREMEDYIGVKFVDDLDTLTASRYLDDFNKINSESIAKDMVRARDPNWTKYISSEYKKLLGEKNFAPFEGDLMKHFSNSDFGLVTQTPGVGGGMAPYRSNLIRAGVSSGAKQYYKIFKANPQRSPIMLKDIMFK